MQVLPQPWNAAAVWNALAPEINPDVRRSLENVLTAEDGVALSRAECLRLSQAAGNDLVAMAAAADLLRDKLVGDTITYVVNRNINFTNVCFVGCKFCAFFRGPNHPEANFYSPEQVAQKAVEARRLGATEVCIQGGLPHGLPKFYYRDILRAIKTAVPDLHIHAFS